MSPTAPPTEGSETVPALLKAMFARLNADALTYELSAEEMQVVRQDPRLKALWQGLENLIRKGAPFATIQMAAREHVYPPMRTRMQALAQARQAQGAA